MPSQRSVASPTVPARHAEIELKFEVPPHWSLPSPAALPGVAAVTRPVRYELDARYYDTDDLDLLASRVTLRRRTGGSDAGWHLKLPGGSGARTEITLDLQAGAEEVPAELQRIVATLTRGKQLRPVARLRTRRIVTRTRAADGTELLEFAEDQVTAGAPEKDAKDIETWREVEVELIGGSTADLGAASALLIDSGATASRSPSKLQRALAAAGRRPTTGPVPAVSKRTGGPEVVRAALLRRRGSLLDAELNLRLGTQGSVARLLAEAQALRCTLSTFAPLIGEVDALRHRLRALIRTLSPLVETERCAERIALGLLEEPPALAGPAGQDLDRVLAQRRGQARAQIEAWSAGPAPAELVRALDDLVAGPVPTGELPTLGELLRESWRTTRRRAAALRTDPEDAHRARKLTSACRSTRHAADLAGVVLGVDAVVFAAALEQVEEVLQHHASCVRTADLLVELAQDPSVSASVGFVWGRLHSFELATAGELTDDLADAWAGVEEKADRRRLR